MRLVLASNNAKKLAELAVLFAPLGLQLEPQGALGIAEAEEPHVTFIENALAKARHAAQSAGGAAIADDSGVCVDALGGAPGVVSAHFAGAALPESGREARRAVQDAANNRLLLERLQDVAVRRARFVSTLVAIRSADDPEPLVAVGRWEGEILRPADVHPDARPHGGRARRCDQEPAQPPCHRVAPHADADARGLGSWLTHRKRSRLSPRTRTPGPATVPPGASRSACVRAR